MNTCFHRSSPRRTALAAAAAALLFGAGTAHAGDFREAALTQFIPQPGYPLTDLMLVALTGSQFNYKTWDRSSGHWSAWHPNVYPTPGGSFTRDDRAHFPLVTWYGGGDGGWRTNGYYNADGLGAPWWQEQGSIFSLDLHGQIVDGHGTRFLPGSGIARRTSVQYLHFFGGSVSDPSCRGLGLRERWWDPEAFQWAWAYHGCPSQLAYPTSVGGQSAATTEQVPYSLQPTFVFATVSPSPAEAELWVRHTSTARPYRDAHEPWAWLRLGRPANTTLMDSEPLTVSYDRGNHIWRTHVFVTAKSNVDGLYHLYERYTDGDNWSDDSPLCQQILVEQLIPALQYFSYIEITPRQHQAL